MSADLAQGPLEQRLRLLQVDDVNLVAHAVEIRRHARVPATRVVTKMHARFEQLAQGNLGHCHGNGLSCQPVGPPRGVERHRLPLRMVPRV